MSEGKNHETVVADQFGSQAAAYLNSTVHSQGADLTALTDLVKGAAHARVLDLGCGAGHVSFNVAPHVTEVVSYDLSAEMLAVVGRTAAERGFANIVTRQGVAERLPFPDASFDFVLSRYSAHHWRDFEAALKEVARVLHPHGVVAFVDAVSPGSPMLDTFLQSIELLRDPSHVRDYSRAEWEAALVRAGLRVSAVESRRVRLEFAVWTQRMRTPKVQIEAIRALQSKISENVISYYKVDADGSFDLDIGIIRAGKTVG